MIKLVPNNVGRYDSQNVFHCDACPGQPRGTLWRLEASTPGGHTRTMRLCEYHLDELSLRLGLSTTH